MVLKHELCGTPGSTAHFRGSKYVQCFTDGIYRKIGASHPLSSPFLPAPNPSQHQSLS